MDKLLLMIFGILLPMTISAVPAFDVEVRGGRAGAADWEVGIRSPGQNPTDQAFYTWQSGQNIDFKLSYDSAMNQVDFLWDLGSQNPISISKNNLDLSNLNSLQVWTKLSNSKVTNSESITLDNLQLMANGQTFGPEMLAIQGPNAFANIIFPTSIIGDFMLTGQTKFIFSGLNPPTGSRMQFHITNGEFNTPVPEPETYLLMASLLGLVYFIKTKRDKKLAKQKI